MPDIDQLFAIAENLTVTDLDDEAWRVIIEGLVDRIEIKERNIKVVWKEIFLLCRKLLVQTV